MGPYIVFRIGIRLVYFLKFYPGNCSTFSGNIDRPLHLSRMLSSTQLPVKFYLRYWIAIYTSITLSDFQSLLIKSFPFNHSTYLHLVMMTLDFLD